MNSNYLSEIEQEFEQDDYELGNNDSSYELDEEYGNDEEMEYSYETDEETGDDGNAEWESGTDEESDLDNETDTDTETDYATWSRGGVYDRDREFEDRIYNALSSNYENELGMELELDAVLHEMEKDYFFGGLKKWIKKKGLGLIRKYAGKLPIAQAIKAASSLARGDIRGLLKNQFLRTAAQFIPGAGPVISKAMGVANDIVNNADGMRQKVQDIVQVGKNAYQNLASNLPDAQNEMQVRNMAKLAYRNAVASHKSRNASRIYQNRSKREVRIAPGSHVTVYPGKVSINKGQQVIGLKPDSIVSVHPTKVVIWETR